MAQSFDDFLDEYYKEIRNVIKDIKGQHKDYSKIIEETKKRFKNKQNIIEETKLKIKNKKRKQTPVIKDTEEFTNEKNKNMNVNSISIGQSNIAEAVKFTRFYGYKVNVTNKKITEKLNYKFVLDNTFLKRIFNKPEKRFSFNSECLKNYKIAFTFSPKYSRKLLDGQVYQFNTFQITLDTLGCYDFTFYHKEDLGKEVVYGLHTLNIDLIIEKLKNEVFGIYDLSEKAKTNMIGSIIKHMSELTSTKKYGIDNSYEVFKDCTNETALMIVDDYEDEELLNSLIDYLE